MANKSVKTIALGVIALSTALFVGCMGSDAKSTQEFGTLSMKVGTGDVNSAAKSGLSKGSKIELSKLIVTIVSNSNNPTATDSIRDTVFATVGGDDQGFTSISTDEQTVDSVYVLKALRTWYLTVETRDMNDSVIHIKRDTVVNLLAGQKVTKTLNLAPRFVMYKAKFSFPDSLTTAVTLHKQKLNVTRLIMVVDNDTVVNEAQAYAAATDYTIDYDYVPVNTGTTVKIYVIGNLTGWEFVGDSVLYSKTDITVAGQAASVNGTQTATLEYVGPQTGKQNLSFVIEKVGLYEVTAETLPQVINKRSSK